MNNKKIKLAKFLLFGSKKSNLILLSIFGLYFLFTAFPNFMFEYKVKQGRFSIYSHDKILNPIDFVNKIESLVSTSELNNINAHFTIYITKSHLEYRLFAHIYSLSFALYNPLTGNIYLNQSDITNNKVSRSTDQFQRSLENTIAHEAVHKLTHHHLGFYRFLTQPAWIREGYPDYVSGESTYNYKQAAPLIKNKTIESNRSAMYLVYLESMRIFKEQGLSFNEVLQLKKDWSEVKKEAFQRILQKSSL